MEDEDIEANVDSGSSLHKGRKSCQFNYILRQEYSCILVRLSAQTDWRNILVFHFVCYSIYNLLFYEAHIYKAWGLEVVQ